MEDNNKMKTLNNIVGSNIAHERNTIGLSQNDLARMVGLGRTSIVNMESGKQSISLSLLYKITNALEVKIKDVIPNEYPYKDISSCTIEIVEILKKYNCNIEIDSSCGDIIVKDMDNKEIQSL